MSDHHADLEDIITRAMEAWRPPPKLSLSEWAERYFYLSAESAAEPGRWKSYPFQRGMMDAVTDPTVEQVSVMKSARVGYTKMIDATVGYFIHQDPSSMLIVQPTVEDAKGFSKEEIAPMLRDCPELKRIVFDEAEEATGPKDSNNTILHKRFPGGVLSLAGANSGTGFRRITRRVVVFDEADAYPASAGSDGDQIKLGIMRTQTFWNRKIIAGSTPLVAGASRIEELFKQGDQRRYYVPCTQCGHMAQLVFRGDSGHVFTFDEGDEENAYFVCQKNGCIIEHKDKRDMVALGEWRAAAPFTGHASFHIWAAYSFAPNASWGHIAKEFLAAKKRPETLRTFVNTVLGESWQEKGDAPEWDRLYRQRERYNPVQQLPPGVLFLTAGVDVQKDRLVYEVVGWGSDKQSWSIEAGVMPVGDTSTEPNWAPLDALLGKTWVAHNGSTLTIHALAVDSGYNTSTVYNWARRYPMSRVIAVKGQDDAKTILSAPSAVDIKTNGKRFARGYKVWAVGVNICKAELYGWLGLPAPMDDEPYPPGFCHFSEANGPDYFKQLTAEHLVTVVDRKGFAKLEWQMIPGRENHWLDARVYSRAAATHVGLDRMRHTPAPVTAPQAPAPVVATPAPAPPAPQPVPPPQPRVGSDWLKKVTDSRFGDTGNWLSKKR